MMKSVVVVILTLTISLVVADQDAFFVDDCSSTIANKVVIGGYLREIERLKYVNFGNPIFSSKIPNIMNDVTDLDSDDLLTQINECVFQIYIFI